MACGQQPDATRHWALAARSSRHAWVTAQFWNRANLRAYSRSVGCAALCVSPNTLRLREAPSRLSDRGMGLCPSRLPLGVRNGARGSGVIKV